MKEFESLKEWNCEDGSKVLILEAVGLFETVKVCESLKECESVEETEEVSGFNPLGSGLFESSRLTTASNRFLQKVARPDKIAAVLHKLWFCPDSWSDAKQW